MRRLMIVVAIAAAACGGHAGRGSVEENQATSPSTDQLSEALIDSTLQAMDARYNRLCAERNEAFAVQDSSRRAELLRLNDAQCQAFSDSLQQFISSIDREQLAQ